jgi:hypothetical protein
VPQTRSQLLELYEKIIEERDPQRMVELLRQLYELLTRLARENFDPKMAA